MDGYEIGDDEALDVGKLWGRGENMLTDGFAIRTATVELGVDGKIRFQWLENGK